MANISTGSVLLVTNNERLRDRFQRALLKAGYGIHVVRSQEEGLNVAQDINPAIIVVDRRESGFSRLHHEMPLPPPIITVMYHTEACYEQHCAMDIEDGAARAVCNASPLMIIALMGAVLRRQQWERVIPERYVADDITIDIPKHEVTVGAKPVKLTATEFRIIESLVVAPSHYLSRTALLDHVWGEGVAVVPHVLDVHICLLRRKLNSNTTAQDLILTVNKLGYKLRPMTLPSEAPFIQPYCPATPGIGLASLPAISTQAPYLRPEHFHGWRFQGRHKPDRRTLARYRIRPAYDGAQG